MDNVKQPSAWKKGKLEHNKFYDIKLNRKTNFITFTFGLITGAVLLLPLFLLLFQFLKVYGYDNTFFLLFIILIWILIMLFNGLSNYFTVKLAQAYNKDMINLQAIKPKYIFLYQTLNIGFALASLFIIVLFVIGFF